MEVISDKNTLQKLLKKYTVEGKSIGFCPTMGYLHQGHISLVEQSKKRCDISVVSIYVNPSQFNNVEDFEKYPRDVEKDLNLLKNNAVDIVWVPNQNEIETVDLNFSIDFKGLDSVMEGFYRPGHFKGVSEVVYRLFKVVQPNFAFFGTKDYQQLQIIKLLIAQNNLAIELVPVETLRAEKGLALSSRNARLSKDALVLANEIFTQLNLVKKNINNTNFLELHNTYKQQLQQLGMEVEYLEKFDFADGTSRLFTAVYLEKVRLIDNIEL